MSEVREKETMGRAAWVRSFGWQGIALILVLCVGFSLCRVSCAVAKQREAEAEVMRDVAKVTGFVTDCLPEGSKDDIKRLVRDATDILVSQARREIDRDKEREARSRDYPERKRSRRYPRSKAPGLKAPQF